MARIYELQVGQRFAFEGIVYVKTAMASKTNRRGSVIVEETGKEIFMPTMTRVQVLLPKEEAEAQPDVVQKEELPID